MRSLNSFMDLNPFVKIKYLNYDEGPHTVHTNYLNTISISKMCHVGRHQPLIIQIISSLVLYKKKIVSFQEEKKTRVTHNKVTK